MKSSKKADGVRIGALATHRMIELSPLIREAFPVVAEAFSHIGNVRVRQTASVGGNLAHADYRLDPPPPLLVLGASVSAFGPKGSRTIELKDFFRGMYETALEPGEILTDVKDSCACRGQPSGLSALQRAGCKRLALFGRGGVLAPGKPALPRIAPGVGRRGADAAAD